MDGRQADRAPIQPLLLQNRGPMDRGRRSSRDGNNVLAGGSGDTTAGEKERIIVSPQHPSPSSVEVLKDFGPHQNNGPRWDPSPPLLTWLHSFATIAQCIETSPPCAFPCPSSWRSGAASGPLAASSRCDSSRRGPNGRMKLARRPSAKAAIDHAACLRQTTTIVP